MEERALIPLRKYVHTLSTSPLRMLLLILSVFLAAGLFSLDAQGWQADDLSAAMASQAVQKQAALQELLPQAQQQGRVRVIVRLNLPFDPQGTRLQLFSAGVRESGIRAVRAAVEERLETLPAETLRVFDQLPVMVLEVDAAGLQELAEDENIASIQADEAVPPHLDTSVPLIGADVVWSEGYRGDGQAIAILDSGVDSDHDFLSGGIVAEACFSSNYEPDQATSFCPGGVEESTDPGAGEACPSGVDGCDHGTHVAGIAAGDGTSYSGVAPDAGIIAVQVFSRFEGSLCTDNGMSSPCALSYTSDQIAALDWIYTQRSTYSIAAVNMSLGGGSYFDACDSDSRALAIDTLRAADIATVASSGNGGFRNAISAPACISSAVSVGSSSAADEVSSFSNVASFLSFLAPGESIESSIPGGYTSMSGTSMAAPHVAGGIALLRSAVPAASLDEVLAALDSTSVAVDDQRSGASVTGMARIDLGAALAALLPEPTPTPTPTIEPTPEPEGSTTWYLAEGFTGGGFGTYILIQNPNPDDAVVDVTYMLQGGGVLNRTLTVGGESRATIIAADDVGVDAAFSTSLNADIPVIVERAMYYSGGGHATIGLTAPASTWYLAEGFTGGGFSTFILVQNPGGSDVDVDVTYMLQGGGTVNRTLTVPAESRETISAVDDVGVDAAFSTQLTGTAPIIVERAMYYAGGAHATIGLTSSALTWYLAEGYTGDGFETFILLQNPEESAANVTITYMLQGGGTINRSLSVAAQSRETVYALDDVGADVAFSTQITSDVPIIVERSMYFATGAHATVGVRSKATTWYLAEGYTGDGFGTYLLLQNPDPDAAEIEITYMLQGGGVLSRTLSLPGQSRETVVALDDVGADAAFSTRVEADIPIIVERAMYFNTGGHATIGVHFP